MRRKKGKGKRENKKKRSFPHFPLPLPADFGAVSQTLQRIELYYGMLSDHSAKTNYWPVLRNLMVGNFFQKVTKGMLGRKRKRKKGNYHISETKETRKKTNTYQKHELTHIFDLIRT